MHLIPVIQLENRSRSKMAQVNSEETVAYAWIHTFQDTFKLQEQTWGPWDSQPNVSAKMHLVPVIQLEIEIARTLRHQLLRRHSHSPECILSKTLSNFKNRHEVLEIFNKMSWQKCIWFQSSNLKSKLREHVTTNLWGDSCICLNAYFPRHFKTTRTGIRSLRYSTKCVGQNKSGSSHPTWKPKLRDDVASKFWGGRCICLSKASSKHSEIPQTAMRLSRYPTKCVGHNGFSKSSRSIWISAWPICWPNLQAAYMHHSTSPQDSWVCHCQSSHHSISLHQGAGASIFIKRAPAESIPSSQFLSRWMSYVSDEFLYSRCRFLYSRAGIP